MSAKKRRAGADKNATLDSKTKKQMRKIMDVVIKHTDRYSIFYLCNIVHVILLSKKLH